MKRIFILLFIVFLASVIASQNPKETIRRAVEAGDHRAAIDSLRQLKAADEKAFTAGDNDYLLARMAEANGDAALAVANYQSVVDRGSLLRHLALRRLARIAGATGNLVLERYYLRQLQLVDGDSVVAKSALLTLAENALAAGNHSAAIAMLNEGAPTQPVRQKTNATVNVRTVKALLADAYLNRGEAVKARTLFEELINTDPDLSKPDDASIKAVRRLDHLDGGIENLGKSVPALPDPEHLRRANVYQFNREFIDARRHFQIVVDNNKDAANIPEAAFQIGRGYVQQSNFVEAVRWFEHIREQHPQSAAAKDALLQAASAYGRLGKAREAAARYQQYIDKYPGDEKIDRAYLNIVDVLRDQGEEAEALRWCARARTELKGSPAESLAMASEARLYMARESWPDALKTLDQLRQMPDTRTLPGGTSPSEVTFARAFVLEQLKRFPEAIDAYLTIPDGREEYYGMLATQRLQALGNDETAASFVAQRLGTASTGLSANEPEVRRRSALITLRLAPTVDVRERALEALRGLSSKAPNRSEEISFTRLFGTKEGSTNKAGRGPSAAKSLAELGLFDDALILLDRTEVGESDRLATAEFYAKANRGDLSTAAIEPIIKAIPADLPIELIPRDELRLHYPAPFREHLLRYAGESGVDPRLLLAIMRQESRFDPNARSNAAARGLMQFTLPTAIRIGTLLGIEALDDQDLYDPAVSIRLGSRYLADLYLKFPNQNEAVAAAYNGGEDNMRRWLDRSRSVVPERYVSEIAYAQSKDYVHKVISNYRAYQFLYDEQLAPR